jgi:hypothetical protein
VSDGKCAPTNCFDGKINGEETARITPKQECGGSTCRACPTAASCGCPLTG